MSSIGVPELDPEKLYPLELRGFEPREVRLVVVDQRRPRPERSSQTVTEMQNGIRCVLTRSAVAVGPKAIHELTVSIGNADRSPASFAQEDCVQVDTTLQWNGVAILQSAAIGCYVRRHLLGFNLGGDATRAYRIAINNSLGQLDRLVAQAAGYRNRRRED